jgi:hypothetical protein
LGRGNAELGCATDEDAEANCYFPGPDEDGQTGTHFYACTPRPCPAARLNPTYAHCFGLPCLYTSPTTTVATALARIDELLEPVGLGDLHTDHGYEWPRARFANKNILLTHYT